MKDVRSKLIENGVKNLREFGYDKVTAGNILVDEVYSRFFRAMLNDNLGHGFDDEIKELLAELPVSQ